MTEAQQYDLIMLGQQTHFHPETQSGPCDTLHAMLKNTPRPVIAVPEKLAGGNSVLIAYDGSPPAVRSLQAFQELGLRSSQEVHVLCVDPDHVEAARRADRAVEFLRLHEVVASPHAIGSSRSPAQVILAQAGHLGASLLVMGSFGHSTLREFFLGSVTRTVLKESTVPLFLYH
jgi:nucleotide-binding universal stress UspA family protein